MKKLLKFKSLLLSIVLLTFVYSCDDDDNQQPEMKSNIVQTAQATDALSSLVAALQKADEGTNNNLVSTLSSDSQFTVFAPTNDAFTALFAELDGFDSLDDFDLMEEKNLLAEILKYHVVAGAGVKAADLVDGQSIKTVQEENVVIRLDGDKVFVQDATSADAEVVIADVEASNGVVHVVNKVLVPQAVLDALESIAIAQRNLVDVVVNTEVLSFLEAAVIKTDLVATLSSAGPFTVFAPTDDAIAALFETLGDDYTSLDDFDTADEIALLKNIILYHVIPNAQIAAGDLAAGSVGTAFAENNIEVLASGGSFVIGDASTVDANITGTDIFASNGVAHTIDKVLLPQVAIDVVNRITNGTLVDIVVATPALSLLEQAVLKADLVGTLNGAGPFTVFAPTDDAFVALLAVLGDDFTSLDDFNTPAEIALLRNILLYHVIPSEVKAGDLAAGMVGTAFAGNSVEVIASGNTFVIGDASSSNANITGTDILASNGVAHTIDKVLLPQAALDFVTRLTNGTLVDIVVATTPLSILEAAVIKTGLVETLNGAGPFTVFAPTNDAFVALLNALGDDYNSLDDFNTTAEIDLLRNILLYHVIPNAEVAAGDLEAGMVGTAFAGNSLEVIASGGSFVIGDASATNATITGTDIFATNGVAHTINKVLLPAAAVEFATRISNGSLVDIVVGTPSLSILEEAVILTGLVDTLNGAGPFTVFAPTNDAFEALYRILGQDFVNRGMAAFDTPERINALRNLLLYHVVPGQVLANQLSAGSVPTAFTGNSFTVVASGNSFVIRDTTSASADAGIVATNILATNGVAHVINQVLVPLSSFGPLH
ncbi:fasciclin domain-containing protein [Cellulophaga sp. Hel_I_12]|uniref:fasciclin domain-containing protein n=1 Tax=Cellulophaga sp. Hel_I_12 TaxID=1249972 RepID=UPI0018CEE468|nr:fasciclin domain-containing protein [Cellulophaga sp. Hel_I_12]